MSESIPPAAIPPTDTGSWQAVACDPALRARALLNRSIRDFFYARGVLEVEVPVLARHAALDPHITSIEVQAPGRNWYLQSSPEYFLKRLLASGSGDIYSLGKAFRAGEAGRRHNLEFTLLEWYRRDMDDRQLMDEVQELLETLLAVPSVRRVSYRQVFMERLGIDPHVATATELRELALSHVQYESEEDRVEIWLDLLMSHLVEPALGEGLVFVYDFPASQAALARTEIDNCGQRVARRFEAYVNGMELANGYWELCDAQEQRRRFQGDQALRRQLGLTPLAVDERLLQALRCGLPDCSGVALGVDRLLMLQLGSEDIAEVLTFPGDRC